MPKAMKKALSYILALALTAALIPSPTNTARSTGHGQSEGHAAATDAAGSPGDGPTGDAPYAQDGTRLVSGVPIDPDPLEGPPILAIGEDGEAPEGLPSGMDRATSASAFESDYQAPYTYQALEGESVNLNTGGLLYESLDCALPGANGMDLEIVSRYDSSRADLYKFSSSTNPLFSTYGNLKTYAVYTQTTQWLERNGTEIPNTRERKLNFDLHIYVDGDTEEDALENAKEFKSSFKFKDYAGRGVDLVQVAGPSSVKECTLRVPIRRAMRANSISYPDLGQGWDFKFPYLEFDTWPNANISDFFYLRREDGSTALGGWDKVGNKMDFLDDAKKVVSLERNVNIPAHGGANLYEVGYIDGKREYFFSNGRLAARTDRYGNTILFEYNASKALTKITDT